MEKLLLSDLTFYTLDDMYVFLNESFRKEEIRKAGEFIKYLANYETNFFYITLFCSFYCYTHDQLSIIKNVEDPSDIEDIYTQMDEAFNHLKRTSKSYKENLSQNILDDIKENFFITGCELSDIINFLRKEFYEIYAKWELPSLAKMMISECVYALSEINSSQIGVFDITQLCKERIEKYKEIAIKVIDNDFRTIDDLSQNISANVICQKDIKKIVTVYTLSDLESLLSFDIAFLQSQNVKIKKCSNCHNYFIPSGRSDQIYCDSISENGKTCKQIGYENKLKKDVFKAAYRKAYKTQRARIKYNTHIPNYEKIHFVPWQQDARKAMHHYQVTNDIEGFKKWLDENRDKYK